MRFVFSPHFTRSYAKAPPAVQRTFDKQSLLLLQDLRHPSIRAKKYEGEKWQGRVNRDWRFYFFIQGDVYYLVDIIPHPK